VGECEASCIVGKVNNVRHQIGAANSTMLGTNSVPLAAPIGAPLSFAWMLAYK